MAKTSVYGDPTWANAMSNLGELFNPRVEAEAAGVRGRNSAYEAQARHNNAQAQAVEDQNRAYDVATLVANGMNPLDARLFVATRDNNLATVGKGLNQLAGGRVLQTGGDPRLGLALTDQANVAANPNFAWTNARADQLNAAETAAKLNQARVVQELQNAGSLDVQRLRGLTDLDVQRLRGATDISIAQGRPFEVSPGASALFAPGDPRNPNGTAKPLTYVPGSGTPPYRPGAMTTPSQIFTAPALPGRTSTNADGTPRTGNPTLDETELLKKIQIEEAGGKALAAQGKYPLQGGAPLSDAVTNVARQAFPTDTPSVAISKWMAANGVTVENDWNALSANQSTLMKGDKPLTLQDLFIPNAPASPAAAPVGGQPAAPSAAPGVTPAQSAAAPAQPAGPIPTKSGGVQIDGIPFEPSRSLAGELQNGDEYVGINAKTNQLEKRYWNEVKGTWSKSPIFQGNEDLGNFQSMRGQNNILGVIPKKDASWAARETAEQAVALGVITPEQLGAARQADLAAGSQETNPGYGDAVQSLLLANQDNIVLAARQKAMQDPRLAKFARGDFSGDAGLPDEAMALAEQMGINRKQFGIPEAGLGEKLPIGLGAVFAPAGYGAAQDTMARGLTEFFKAVQEGRVDPRTLVLRRPSDQPVAAR